MIDPKLAAYAAYWYRGYACNPRAIYEKARELAPDVRGVWIVKAEDQPKARALLREAGIEPATRFADDLAKARTPVQDAQTRRSVIVWRIRLLLVGLIALLILLRVLGIVKFY